MKLLLHICCANCGLVPIELLKSRTNADSATAGQTGADNFPRKSALSLRGSASIMLFWYNPNIHPAEEYEKRLVEVKKLAEIYHLPLIIGDYEKEKWFNLTKGLENEPEGGRRCEICFRMRLEKTAKMATQFDYFSTTLGISRYKNTDLINQIGQELAKKYKIKFYPFIKIDQKDKKNVSTYTTITNKNNATKNYAIVNTDWAFQYELELSKKYNFYRQKYCGCIYSQKINKNYKTAKPR